MVSSKRSGAQFTEEDDALLAELGIEVEARKVSSRTPREERIIAGFEEIERFVDEHGRPPQHGEEKDIFERLYAVRMDTIRNSAECRKILAELDSKGLLAGEPILTDDLPEDVDDEALLAELGVDAEGDTAITKLKHVRTRAEIKAAEEIAQRTPCKDFDTFKPLLAKVQEELREGVRESREFKDDASVKLGECFILGGQKVYVAEMGDEFINDYDRPDRRLRVIYDNGTESDILLRSLQRALNKDDTARRITDPSAGPLFSDEAGEEDIESGTIYVLQSNSDDPYIKDNRNVIHKIGVTGGDVKKRFANARHDPTFLMADVEVVATYQLSNINRIKLENLIHRFFDSARLDVQIKDRFGKPITPREWVLVPFSAVDEAVERIKDGTIKDYYYKPDSASLVLRDQRGESFVLG